MNSPPRESFPYFWDIDPETLDAEKDASFIIRRLFEWGDLDEVRWLLKTYPIDRLRSELKNGRSLSPKSACFWARLLDVPPGELRCIRKRSTLQRESAWPY